MLPLLSLGFSPFFLAQLDPDELGALPVGRVAASAHERFTLLTAGGPREAVLGGRARLDGDVPAVGDWVVVEGEDLLRVRRRLDRASVFRRRGPDGRPQVVAANVDTVFVVTSLDADFSVRRVERYLAALTESGARAVVVLTKADLVDDPLPRVRALERSAGAVPVVCTSRVAGQGRDALLGFVGPGGTAAFAGSSGVGKSTLVNWLLEADAQATGPVRAADGKGRHTTTARSLVPLPGGGLLLDTPGMRGFAPWDDADLDAGFADLAALAARCRFGDCRHADEPGCAVTAAVARGEVDAVRLAAWDRLKREAAHAARRDDPDLARAERDRWKRIHLQARARDRHRERERG